MFLVVVWFLLSACLAQNEQRLLVMLDKVRHGNFDWGVQHMLQQELQRPLDESDGIKPTELFPTNRQVPIRQHALLPTCCQQLKCHEC